MVTTAVSVVLILVVCALLAWSLHSFVPYAGGALGVIALNIPHASRSVQHVAFGLTLVCLIVSCINQHKVPEGTARTDAQRRSESRADRYAVYTILLAVFYTVGTWMWKFLGWIGVDDFFKWLWKASLRLNVPVPLVVGGLILAFVAFLLVRRARRRAQQQTTSGSSNPAPATNLSSVS